MSVIGKNYGKPTLDLNFAGNKSLIDTTTGTNYVTFSRAQSGNEATYVGSDGLIKYASADEPRFDHDPVTGESLGLLVEELRTNIYPYSETSGSWNVDNDATISTDGTTIDGLTAIKLTSNVDTNALFLEGEIQAATLTANTTYTSSVYHKPGNVDGFWFEARFYTGGGTPKIYFDSSTETWSANSGTFNGQPWSVKSQKVESNAWRHSITFYIDTDTAGTLRVGGLAPANTTDVSTGDYGYLAAPQIEAGAFPTSYIPTSGSTVTRAADEASITGTNFSRWYNQSEGTMFVDSSALGLNTLNRTAYITDGSTSNSLGIVETSSLTQFLAYTGGVLQANLSFAQTGLSKKAFAYAVNDAAFTADGNSALTDTSVTLPGLDRMDLISRLGADPLNGHISRLTYYPKRLPDIELQQLTK